MIIFDSKNKINEKLKEENLRSAHLLRLKGYGSFNYTCINLKFNLGELKSFTKN